MGEIRKTYTVEFKLKAVEMYINDLLGYKTIAKKLSINDNMVRRWVAHYQREGLVGLEEKRGKATGPNKGVPKVTKPANMEEELMRLRAENEYLKKLWELERGKKGKGPTGTPL